MPNLGLDLERNEIFGRSIAPQNASTTVNGASVDFQEAEGPVTAILLLGTVTGSGSWTFALQESSDDSTFTAFSPAANTWTKHNGTSIATFDQAEDNSMYLLTTYDRSKRYVRIVGTLTGTGSAWNMAAGLMSKSKSY